MWRFRQGEWPAFARPVNVGEALAHILVVCFAGMLVGTILGGALSQFGGYRSGCFSDTVSCEAGQHARAKHAWHQSQRPLSPFPFRALVSSWKGAPCPVLVFTCSTATCLFLSNAIIAPLASFSENATGLFVPSVPDAGLCIPPLVRTDVLRVLMMFLSTKLRLFHSLRNAAPCHGVENALDVRAHCRYGAHPHALGSEGACLQARGAVRHTLLLRGVLCVVVSFVDVAPWPVLCGSSYPFRGNACWPTRWCAVSGAPSALIWCSPV